MFTWIYRIVFIFAVPAVISYNVELSKKEALIVFGASVLFVILEIVLRKIFCRSRAKADFVLDSSALSDGRVFNIAKTNLLSAIFIIPKFVIDDLKLIANSNDPVKRNRAKRVIREAFAVLYRADRIPRGYFIVIAGRAPCFDKNNKMQDVLAYMESALTKLNLLKP